jgi:hypothetical protein
MAIEVRPRRSGCVGRDQRARVVPLRSVRASPRESPPRSKSPSSRSTLARPTPKGFTAIRGDRDLASLSVLALLCAAGACVTCLIWRMRNSNRSRTKLSDPGRSCNSATGRVKAPCRPFRVVHRTQGKTDSRSTGSCRSPRRYRPCSFARAKDRSRCSSRRCKYLRPLVSCRPAPATRLAPNKPLRLPRKCRPQRARHSSLLHLQT